MPIPVISSTSTVPMVKQQLVAQITTALAHQSTSGGQVPVSYAWTGANTKSEAVFLGNFDLETEQPVESRQEVRGLNPGRHRRDEEYDIPVTVATFRPDLRPADAATCEARAFTLASFVEEISATDLSLGLTGAIVRAVYVSRISSTLRPHEGGWACQVVLTMHVLARLT